MGAQAEATRIQEQLTDSAEKAQAEATRVQEQLTETERSFAAAKHAAEKSETQVSSLHAKLQENEKLHTQKLREASDKHAAECAKLEKDLESAKKAQQDTATKQPQ